MHTIDLTPGLADVALEGWLLVVHLAEVGALGLGPGVEDAAVAAELCRLS